MLKAIKFPASIPDLNAGLTDVNGNALSHFRRKRRRIETGGKNSTKHRKSSREWRLSRRFSGGDECACVRRSLFYNEEGNQIRTDGNLGTGVHLGFVLFLVMLFPLDLVLWA